MPRSKFTTKAVSSTDWLPRIKQDVRSCLHRFLLKMAASWYYLVTGCMFAGSIDLMDGFRTHDFTFEVHAWSTFTAYSFRSSHGWSCSLLRNYKGTIVCNYPGPAQRQDREIQMDAMISAAGNCNYARCSTVVQPLGNAATLQTLIADGFVFPEDESIGNSHSFDFEDSADRK